MLGSFKTKKKYSDLQGKGPIFGFNYWVPNPSNRWMNSESKKNLYKTNHCHHRVLSHKVKAWDSTCDVRVVGDDTRANGSWAEIDSLAIQNNYNETKLPENIVSICNIQDMLILSPTCTKLFSSCIVKRQLGGKSKLTKRWPQSVDFERTMIPCLWLLSFEQAKLRCEDWQVRFLQQTGHTSTWDHSTSLIVKGIDVNRVNVFPLSVGLTSSESSESWRGGDPSACW